MTPEDLEKARQLLIKFGSFEQNEIALDVINNKLGKFSKEELDHLIYVEQLIYAVNALAEHEVNMERIERQKKIDEREWQKKFELFKQFMIDTEIIRRMRQSDKSGD